MNKKRMRLISGILVLVALIFLFMPTYIQEALIYWYPDISDTYIFKSDTVTASDSCYQWMHADNYNAYVLNEADDQYLDVYKTVSFLVIQDDHIVYEEYRDKWDENKLSNIFSATKSIVGLLAGIAHDEGFISSLDDKVNKYLPEFADGDKLTVRNLLTMSSGLNWDEAYTSLFSKTTEAYYGDNIRELMMGLKVVEQPGLKFSYKSGDTQLLSFVVEAATGKTISEYATEKLWQPMNVCRHALWNLDRAGGDEKAYCCFNTTARDLAHLGRLVLNGGNWNGKQLISEEYIKEATSPATYLENEFGDGPLDYYGFQIWIMEYQGMKLPLFRGLDGQYLFMIPEKNAIVVRLGHKRSKVYERERTTDIEGYLDIAFKMLR
ncbi:beta-lactamase family protein [Odoribacter sp. OttesenSCG-928-G04]|nr:beta-lactamase family protein [Odoribacter sp. OttesenSCG-928-G04]MDL2331188.1 beta-lactamase family protein [Odoribacter sp. OttesenSCG-928-A06]